jgi:hypothetical protein
MLQALRAPARDAAANRSPGLAMTRRLKAPMRLHGIVYMNVRRHGLR